MKMLKSQYLPQNKLYPREFGCLTLDARQLYFRWGPQNLKLKSHDLACLYELSLYCRDLTVVSTLWCELPFYSLCCIIHYFWWKLIKGTLDKGICEMKIWHYSSKTYNFILIRQMLLDSTLWFSWKS